MNESTTQTQAASFAVESLERWSWTADQLAELNRKLDKPFGEVERFDQALAFVLYKSGHPVEVSMHAHHWLEVVHPLWLDGTRYRILPHREVV